jgi:hypothetical protein
MDAEKNAALIQQFENDLRNLNETDLFFDGKGCVPASVIIENNKPLFQMVHVGNRSFRESFFDETLAQLKSVDKDWKARKFNVNQLLQLSEETESLNPSLLIFHVSRCGSTLISQMLAQSDACLALSEVPLFDEWLRISERGIQIDPDLHCKILLAIIRIHAQIKNKNEKFLIIKWDSWHLMFFDVIRKLFPDTPSLFMYRDPKEVYASQMRSPAMHAVPGFVHPSVFGWQPQQLVGMNHMNYFPFVLEKYFFEMKSIIHRDKNLKLLPYRKNAEINLNVALQLMNYSPDDVVKQQMLERAKFHSKKPKEVFDKDPEEEFQVNLFGSPQIYHELNQLQTV